MHAVSLSFLIECKWIIDIEYETLQHFTLVRCVGIEQYVEKFHCVFNVQK